MNNVVNPNVRLDGPYNDGGRLPCAPYITAPSVQMSVVAVLTGRRIGYHILHDTAFINAIVLSFWLQGQGTEGD